MQLQDSQHFRARESGPICRLILPSIWDGYLEWKSTKISVLQLLSKILIGVLVTCISGSSLPSPPSEFPTALPSASGRGLGLSVQGAGCRVQGAGFRVQGTGGCTEGGSRSRRRVVFVLVVVVFAVAGGFRL